MFHRDPRPNIFRSYESMDRFVKFHLEVSEKLNFSSNWVWKLVFWVVERVRQIFFFLLLFSKREIFSLHDPDLSLPFSVRIKVIFLIMNLGTITGMLSSDPSSFSLRRVCLQSIGSALLSHSLGVIWAGTPGKAVQQHLGLGGMAAQFCS